MTNAEKIAAWRLENPGQPITYADLLQILSLPHLQNARLRSANLRGANLRGVDLRGVYLRDADLWNTCLQGADLRGADLWGADLRGANLLGANLRKANLRNTVLYADLQYANLWGADLRDASIRGALLPGYMPIRTPSGTGYLIPTPEGWRITIGCWHNYTLDDLADLIHDRTEWPEATGSEREQRRPILAALHALATAHADYYANVVAYLAKKWGAEL